MARYAGQFTDPVEVFGIWPKGFFVPLSKARAFLRIFKYIFWCLVVTKVKFPKIFNFTEKK